MNQQPSKHAKYKTRNVISQYLVNGFFQTIETIVAQLSFESVLDVGCGEGMLLKNLAPYVNEKTCHGIDLDPAEVADAAQNLPFCQVKVGSTYDIPFPDASFDLVICTEVLEHLETPEKALSEFARVSRKFVLLSVPREPIWRGLNMVRGSYLSALGNTPDHLNHWSRHSFKKFVFSQFDIVECQTPLPWTVLLGQKR